jgi:hypothetical protein
VAFRVRKHWRMAGIDAADRRTRYQRLHSALNNRQDRSVPQRFDIDPGHGAKLASRDARRNIAGGVMPLLPLWAMTIAGSPISDSRRFRNST